MRCQLRNSNMLMLSPGKLRRILVRGLKLPWQIPAYLVDRVIARVWLRLQGLECGPGCRFVGIPVVNIVPGARIILGINVGILSRFNSNPRGTPHPTILSAAKTGAVIEIGDHSGMTGTSIIARERVTIGKWVQIGPGVCISDNDAHPLDPNLRRQRPTRDHRCAPVTIEDDVFIGTRALILKGVTIGTGAVVGAGAVVTKSVKPYEIVAGNPARVVGTVPISQDQPR